VTKTRGVGESKSIPKEGKKKSKDMEEKIIGVYFIRSYMRGGGGGKKKTPTQPQPPQIGGKGDQTTTNKNTNFWSPFFVGRGKGGGGRPPWFFLNKGLWSKIFVLCPTGAPPQVPGTPPPQQVFWGGGNPGVRFVLGVGLKKKTNPQEKTPTPPPGGKRGQRQKKTQVW